MAKTTASKSPVWKAVCAGTLTGVINGVFGAGGGMVLAPLFLRWLKLDEKKALATSVAVIMPLCALTAAIYASRGALRGITVWPYLAGGLAGGVVGGLTFGKVSAVWLRRFFALFVLYGGVRFLIK